MRENKRLSAKQQRALEALLREPTTRAAAANAQVSEATIFRWLADPIFSATYKASRAQLLESTLAALQSAGSDAADCLREIANDKTTQPAARVSAAKAIIELGRKGREGEVEERLAALEARLAAQQPLGVKR